MRYETELLQLGGMLRSYIRKVGMKYPHMGDIDDVMQECFLNAIKSVSGDIVVRNPKAYFISVFNNTIKRIGREGLLEWGYDDISWHEEDEELEAMTANDSIMEALDGIISKQSEMTNQIWDGLKAFGGDCSRVGRFVGVTPKTISMHKRTLRQCYAVVMENR